MTDTPASLTALTAQIVSAYVTRNEVARGDIGRLVAEVHQALTAISGGNSSATPAVAPAKASLKKTVYPDYLICLEDGQRFKSLKRHLRVKYGLTPEQYRTKWGLAADYPMVAPRYAEKRSSLAKSMGLGQSAKRKR